MISTQMEWNLRFVHESEQSVEWTSFIGGKPIMPAGLGFPRCTECGSDQSFFFQLAFPIGHSWSGMTLAVFACIACANKNLVIPPMINSPLRDANIPDQFLEQYQRNFRLLVYRSSDGAIRPEIANEIAYKRIVLEPTSSRHIGASKLGGGPNWLLDDESPATYAGAHEMVFLMQLGEDLEFETIPGARRQMTIGLTGKQELSGLSYYQLFNGNRIFFFGVGRGDNRLPLVYVLTQI